jgi:adenylylsulfate kinase
MENEAGSNAVLITGTIGAGKTVIATAMGELLEARGIPSAILDLDWLGWVHRPALEHSIDDLIASNLAAVVPNLRSVGIRHYVLARSITTIDQVDGLRRALHGASLVVVRLTASSETISRRLVDRDHGYVLDQHLAQSRQFATDQAHAGLADFELPNEKDSVRDVATALLMRLGWD